MRQTYFSILIIAFALSACVATENKSGQVIRKEALESLKEGESTKDDVLGKLGSPSTVSDFGPERWYYMSKTTKTVAVLSPEVTDLKVVEIEFSDDGKIKHLTKFTKADMKNLSYAQDKTPTAGQEYTLIKQLLGNIGRFNKEPADSK